MQRGNYPEIVEYGCDWLTFTATESVEEKQALQMLYDSCLVAYTGQGHTPKKEKRLGYTGNAIAGVFHGIGAQGAMLQASGIAAQRVLRSVVEWQHRPHVTRIDWQVTCHMGEDLVDYVDVAIRESEVSRNALPAALQWKLTHYRGFGKGDSAYIGARTSQVCCRVYDKTAESNGQYPKGTWRYEVEYKGKVAENCLRDYIQSEEKIDWARDIVAGELQRRGVIVPFYESTIPRHMQAKRPETSNEKRLVWMRDAVRPALEELKKSGLLQDAKQALGLDVS